MDKKERLMIIRPTRGWRAIDFKELWQFRDVAFILALRDIKVRYKQTFFGAAWAIMQPFLSMVVFTIFFGKMTKIPTDGIPYPIFSYSGLLLWQYFSQAITYSSNSLNININLITKIYFPRILIPISATIFGLLDYCVAGVVLIGMMAFYHYSISLKILFVPIILFLTWILAVGVGLWLSALNVKYRDIRYALPFFVQMWMFISPVIYPSSILGKYRWISYVNPVSGLITAHRAVFLQGYALDLNTLLVNVAVILVLFVSGLYYFKGMEKDFADRL